MQVLLCPNRKKKSEQITSDNRKNEDSKESSFQTVDKQEVLR